MTALKGKDIAAFVKKRDPKFHAVLIYGPDGGSVRERSDLIARQVVEDLKDPFNAIELGESDLKEAPSRLADEAAALSMMGGERLVRTRGQSEAITSSARLLLDGIANETIKPNALTIIEAGELRKTSGLRKLFEQSKVAVALPCYEDSVVDLKTMVLDALKDEQMTIEEEALGMLTASLGTDRGISRAELDKLILYMGPKGLREGDTPVKITSDDVQSCLTDATQDETAKIASLATGGQRKELSSALMRANAAGVSPIAILIFLQRQVQRLYTVQSHISDGTPTSSAMKKLRPPVFYAEERAFSAQLQRWSKPKLEKALTSLLETEHAAKQTGAPVQELVERAALRLAMMAGR
jgi:DNA polymerase-3 subunit delta